MMLVDQKINKQIVGVYLMDGTIDGVQLGTTIKPSWLKRQLTYLLLGWKWISIEKIRKYRDGT